jgi:hypothetical protein
MGQVRIGGFWVIALTAVLSGAAAPVSAQAPAGDQKKDGVVTADQTTQVPPRGTVKASVERWFDVQTASVMARYRRVETTADVVTSNHMQDSVALKARFKFDPKGRLTLNAGVATGSSFTGGWNNTGWGTGGDAVFGMYLKQLFLAATPVKGVDASYGGLAFVRGESTEITSYDNDGYMVGARVTLKRPNQFFLDEISFTNAYVCDVATPGFSDRYSRLGDANYHHLLLGKRVGKVLGLSADYTRDAGVDVLRTAFNLKTPKARVIDFVRYEQYKRFGETAAFGFAAYGEKALTRRVSVGAGYADIDPKYGGRNADRFNKGRRLYEQATLKVTRDLSVSAFLTQAVNNSYAVANARRIDLVVVFNALGPVQRAGMFR